MNQPLGPGPHSLWAQVCQLDTESMHQIRIMYDSRFFPIEFRHYFADLIEMQQWDGINPDHPDQAENAQIMLQEWLKTIQHQIANIQPSDFLTRFKLIEIMNTIQNEYAARPLELVRRRKEVLANEKQVVARAHESSSVEARGPLQMEDETIRAILQDLYNCTQKTEECLREAQSAQEYFVIRYQEQLRYEHEVRRLSQEPEHQERCRQFMKEKEKYDQELNARAQNILLHQLVLEKKLMGWKQNQVLLFNGGQNDDTALKNIQEYCEKLAEILWSNRQQIKRCELQKTQLPISSPDASAQEPELPRFNAQLTAQLSSLVTSSFVIERQPPQVLKTQTRFGAQVRLLIGNKLSIHVNPPQVRAIIVSEAQAREILIAEDSAHHLEGNGILNTKMYESYATGEILNSVSTMEYNSTSGILSANFRNMSLRRIRRPDKKGSDTVTEEKFTILFLAEFHVGTKELVFYVRALSLPIVVIVHGNQETNASASILWDNAFSEPQRIPFAVPEAVEWHRLRDCLNMKWKAETCCSFDLSDRSLAYLGFKLFRGNPFNDKSIVTWAMFNKENLVNRTFTFWQWFDSTLKLMKDRKCNKHWQQQAIVGFISKPDCESILCQQLSGTFMLRFSDSELGALTFAFNQAGIVQHLKPQTTKDFLVKDLNGQCCDFNQFMYCYKQDGKTVPKSELFQLDSAFEKDAPTHDGYVPVQITVSMDDKLTSRSPGFGSPASPLQQGVITLETEEYFEYQWSQFRKENRDNMNHLWQDDDDRNTCCVLIDNEYHEDIQYFYSFCEEKFNYEESDETDYAQVANQALETYKKDNKREFCYLKFSKGEKEIGQVDVELFINIVPKTCENFKNLCTSEERSYKNSIIHRVVPNGWIQGGDIEAGKGDGGHSSYSEKFFADENFAVKHDIRGILGMANQGPHTNNSQFYMTLNSTPFMDKKYVAFGRVIRGSQTLNTIERAEAVNERPTEPITVTASGLL
ncbi:Oidioi.mRNA.OKI2018_I69.chr2.g7474.t1.cds [Oikopleura dioica]|uniref:Signal transducer and activator of transcription n=1 Tax=Oikopleura dioica TaxID=34765 RepID=A0ABN7T6A6_OIKDI|nr:Oidioi.mRNA.OKI2018_I69.chr2.g7474.t1.cds [Oikopleura dioica]